MNIAHCSILNLNGYKSVSKLIANCRHQTRSEIDDKLDAICVSNKLVFC